MDGWKRGVGAQDAAGWKRQIGKRREPVRGCDTRRKLLVRASVIIPAFNERATIEEIIRRVRAVALEKEILIVDDGSGDGTREYLASLDASDLRVLLHDENRGKGAAIRTALPHTTGEVVLIQDADLEYDPHELVKLIGPIEAGDADVVYGSRFLARGRGSAGVLHYAANRLLTFLSNLTTGLALTDMETCYKALRGDLARSLDLTADGFNIEPEITARAAGRGARFVEVPIGYEGRAASEGKKIRLKDAFEAVWMIARCARAARATPAARERA